MKIEARKRVKLNEFLSRITPAGGEIHSEVTFKEGDKTIKIGFDDVKPENASHQQAQPESDSQTNFEQLRHCSRVLAEAYEKVFTDLMPPEAEEMVSETTLKRGRVLVRFKLHVESDKLRIENTHKRTHDAIDNEPCEEGVVKKRRFENN